MSALTRWQSNTVNRLQFKSTPSNEPRLTPLDLLCCWSIQSGCWAYIALCQSHSAKPTIIIIIIIIIIIRTFITRKLIQNRKCTWQQSKAEQIITIFSRFKISDLNGCPKNRPIFTCQMVSFGIKVFNYMHMQGLRFLIRVTSILGLLKQTWSISLTTVTLLSKWPLTLRCIPTCLTSHLCKWLYYLFTYLLTHLFTVSFCKLKMRHISIHCLI